MKRFGKLMMALGLAVLCSMPVAAADIDGTWILERETQAGNIQKWVVDFQSQGETLTGNLRVDGTENQWDILDGKLTGNDFSFAILFKRRDGAEARILLVGTVAGQQLSGTIKLPNGNEGRDFKATKQ